MIKALIIEDELPAAWLMREMVHLLRPDWDIEVIPGSVDDALAWFGTHSHPHIIFLDIQLSDGDAFSFLSEAQPQSAIIFTTAYDQYAIRAFSVNSIDYILKPVQLEQLSAAITKFERFYLQSTIPQEQYLETLLSSLSSINTDKYRSRFMISDADGFWVLRVEDVAYFHSKEKITYAATASGREYVLDLSLNSLEEELNPKMFFRVNRQMIVNVDAIDKATPLPKGRIRVHVNPKFPTEIIVSEGRATAFKLWLNF